MNVSDRNQPAPEVTIPIAMPSHGEVSGRPTNTRAIPIRPFGAPRRVDVVIAMDSSGSMKDDKIEAASRAARLVVQHLLSSPTVRIGLVTFSGTARLRGPLQPASQFTPRVCALDNGDLGDDGTNIEAGLQCAARSLSDVSCERVVVVLSDGQATTGDALIEAASLKRSGVTILTVAFGGPGEVDHDALRAIASSPAHFHVALSPEALSDLFDRVGRTISVSVRSGASVARAMTTV